MDKHRDTASSHQTSSVRDSVAEPVLIKSILSKKSGKIFKTFSKKYTFVLDSRQVRYG